MAVTGVNPTANTAYTPPVGTASNAAAAQIASGSTQNTAAAETDTFVKSAESASSDTSKIYKRDTAKLAELRAADKAYLDNLQNLVSELVNQVGKNQSANGANSWYGSKAGRLDPNNVDSYWDVLVDNGDGTFSFHPDLSVDAQNALIAKAKEDISEDGYYGVKQTSTRILDYAKAITGGDPSKIGEMRKMAQAAFDDVAKIMGGKLPQISQDTYDAVMKGFDEWEASVSTGTAE
ncbi:MAG: hypothetical protein LBR85_08710 [Oscillospiraceae bacterium]|nr:hypothetical protein [Oscillospiraceae bacterium]